MTLNTGQKEWQACKFGELFEVKHGFAFKGEHFATSGEFILLTPGNFAETGGLKHKGEREKFYAGAFPEDYLLCRGDLLVAMTDLTQEAPILGSPAFIPEDGRYLHNQRLGKIVNLKRDRIVPEFLYYLLNTASVRDQIKGSATGATVRHTSPSRIYDVRAAIPPLSEQRQIAAVLSAYDELIENSQRRIQVLEQMARSLYREWFVDFRFPRHEKVTFVDSALGRIPEGWEVKTLSEIADINRAQIKPTSPPEELHYIDISSVSPGRVESTTDYSFADAPGRARRIVAHGDVLWSCVRPNRRSHAQVLHPRSDTIASTGFAVLTPKSVPFPFLYLATTTDSFVAYLTSHATGAAYPAVTSETFENAQCVVPSPDLLRRFGGFTIPMAEERDTLERQVLRLRNTRDLLLPSLISHGGKGRDGR